MAKYFVKKGIQLIIVTILISFFSFAVIYAAPGERSAERRFRNFSCKPYFRI